MMDHGIVRELKERIQASNGKDKDAVQRLHRVLKRLRDRDCVIDAFGDLHFYNGSKLSDTRQHSQP